MAIAETQVKKDNATAAGALAVTFTSTTTNHALLVAVLTGYTTDVDLALGPITAPAGWLEAITNVAHNFGVAIYYYPNAPAISAAISFTWANSERTVLCLGEYADMNLTDVLNEVAQHNEVLGDGATGDTATTDQGAELCIGGLAAVDNITFSGFTNSFASAQTDIASASSIYNRLYHLKRIVSSTGSYGTVATPSGTGALSLGAIATFRGNVATGTMTLGTDRVAVSGRGLKLSSTFTQDGVMVRPLASGVYRG